MAEQRYGHAYDKWQGISRCFRQRRDAALKDAAFFEAYLNEALDCHAIWHLHRKGKHLNLELECDELGYVSIPLNARQFDVIVRVLVARGDPVE